jgi:hypothetical protein
MGCACAGSSQLVVVCLVEPGLFRDLHNLVQTSAEGLGRLEVVSLAATGGEEGPLGEAGVLAGGMESLSLASSSERHQQQHSQQSGDVARWVM